MTNLDEAVKAAEEWYQQYEELCLPFSKVQKLILSGHEGQDELKSKYDNLMVWKNDIKLKFEGHETGNLNKIHKWNQIALDCRALVSTEVK